jgi:hypothetical protein
VLFSPWWLSLLIFFSLPVSGLFAWNYYLLFRRIISGFRIRKLKSVRDTEYLDLKRNYDELITLLSGIKNGK